MSTPQPREHQVEALAHLTAALALHDRTQLIMACGTGKTLVGRWHAQAADAHTVLVLVPSLALVAQTLREWRAATGQGHTGWRFRALVVCSDPSIAAGIAERALEDDDTIEITQKTWDQVAARVTLDPGVVRRFLNDPAGVPRVVFSTYHSSPVVAAAQTCSETAFDLAIADEAHRVAGASSDAFRTILDSRQIVARKRVFMTATPKVLAVTNDESVSMDDPALFGPVAHTVSFSDAITAGLLSDYRVLVATEHTDDPTYAPAAALVRAVDDYGVRRVLSFHGRVAKATAFANDVQEMGATPAGAWISARHINGAMDTSDRTQTLEWLGDTQPAEVRVVSNARCLSEGVDVPAVDGVLFADTRSSVIDIIQAIGRVLRPAEGKTVGTIILPVAVPADADPDTVLGLSAFSQVWAVLRGLRAHDQRLADDLDQATRDMARDGEGNWWGHHGRGGHRVASVEFLFPDGHTPPDLHLRLVEETGSMWERNYGLLEAWAAHHDGKLIPRAAKSLTGTVSLGEWCEQQRILHRRGHLPAERARRLEEIPGWAWDKDDARWWQTHQLLADHARGHGTVAENPAGGSVFAGVYSKTQPRRHLGVWAAEQRQAHRLGTLTGDKADALEALPGWAWDAGLPATDVAMVEALRVFVEFEKHANVPDDHVEDGLRLGAWCWAVRRRKLTGHLAPALLDEIIAATPSQWRPAERFQWEQVECQWRIGYFALRQYTDREGAATPTGSHRETLPDTTVNLGQWCANQRMLHRRDDVTPDHVRLLEAMPGWRWEVDLLTTAAQPPVDLPDNLGHGTPGAYGPHKCRCTECLEWRRRTDRERLARQRMPKDPAPAAKARAHVEAIEARIKAERRADKRNGRPLIAAVAGIPLGALRKIMRGADLAERPHVRALLAVRVDVVLAEMNAAGSRGRATAAVNERIDPGPTFVLLDDLKARGFGPSWVARELGYTGSSGIQIHRDRQIVRRIADQVAALHAAVGDLVMPPIPRTVKRPTLAELKTQHAKEDAA